MVKLRGYRMQSYRFFFKQNQCHSETDKTFKYWQVQKVNEIQAGGTEFYGMVCV